MFSHDPTVEPQHLTLRAAADTGSPWRRSFRHPGAWPRPSSRDVKRSPTPLAPLMLRSEVSQAALPFSLQQLRDLLREDWDEVCIKISLVSQKVALAPRFLAHRITVERA